MQHPGLALAQYLGHSTAQAHGNAHQDKVQITRERKNVCANVCRSTSTEQGYEEALLFSDLHGFAPEEGIGVEEGRESRGANLGGEAERY